MSNLAPRASGSAQGVRLSQQLLDLIEQRTLRGATHGARAYRSRITCTYSRLEDTLRLRSRAAIAGLR